MKILNFVIESLFLTNIWIILYSHLITYLNYLFPVGITVNFYRPAVAFPEKFEMPLYLLLSFLFVIAIWILRRIQINPFLCGQHSMLSLLTKIIVLIFLLAIFLSKLGIYPLSNEIYPYQFRPDKTIYTVTLFLYLSAFVIIILETVIIERFFSKLKVFPIFLYAFIAFLIAFFIFEPRFPVSPLEYGFFFGPIWEVVHGKTIFTDIYSQYGFISILFFSVLFKIGLFSFFHLSIYNWIFHIIQYLLSFYLIYKLSKSVSLALIGLFSILTLNYSSFYIPILTIAQYGALRRLPFFLSLFLLYKLKKLDSPVFIFLYALMSFWIVDSGIQMILAYGLTIFYLMLGKAIDIKKAVKSIFLLFLNLAGIFIFINIAHLLFGWKAINVFEITSKIRQYAISGVGMIPMEFHTYFWFMILIYLASVIYFFKKNAEIRSVKSEDIRFERPWEVRSHENSGEHAHRSEKRGIELLNIMIFSANISLFASLYFVGRSDNASLVIISIFPLLNLFLLIALTYDQIKSARGRIVLNIFLFALLIAFPAYNRRFTLTELLLKKYYGLTTGKIFNQELDKDLIKRFSKEKELIAKNITNNEALILSSDETYLFYLTNKKNLLDSNPQSGIESDIEMTFAVKNAIKKCPQKIAVDCSVVNKCASFTPFTKGWLTAGYILKEIEKNCNISYKPTICTNQLCVAEKKF